MIDFKVVPIEDNGQVLETNGVKSNVEFSSIYTDIPEGKQDLFSEVYTSMKEVDNLIRSANLISDLSKNFSPNSPRLKEALELIKDNDELIGDIFSYMYNRIAIESNCIAAKAMKKIDRYHAPENNENINFSIDGKSTEEIPEFTES